MPAISPKALVGAITNAIAESGYTARLASPVREHPRRFILSGPGSPNTLSVYAWTLTFGGRPNLPNEYRIQMTSVTSPLDDKPGGPTILIGYEPELNLFGGFDLERHRTFTTGSPSVQINRLELEAAETEGMIFQRKSNDEIAIGFRPDMLMAYANNAADLHRYGRDARMFRLLNEAVQTEVVPREIEDLPAERQRILREVSRLTRAADFRQRILFTYGNRCAVSRVQLRLVDAAHILPVGAPRSSDHVRNGLCLSPTYHRAFDSGLIYLDEDYRMQINPGQLELLETANLAGGLDVFRARLGERIFLPPDRSQRPGLDYIRRANKFRQVN